MAAIAGCAGTRKVKEGSRWVQTEVYFGRNIPAGGAVSEEQFARFLDEVITPEFPQGLTVFDAYGQMRHEDGMIEKQQTKAVLLVHEKTGANSDAVESIISEYRARFGKPQVMHTTQPLEVEFFGD